MLFFFWKGRGALIPLCIVLNVFITGAIATAIGLEARTIPLYALEFAIALVFFIPIWIYGKKWNAQTTELVEKNTGLQFILKNQHSFFAIPMQYWAIIWPVILLIIFSIPNNPPPV